MKHCCLLRSRINTTSIAEKLAGYLFVHNDTLREEDEMLRCKCASSEARPKEEVIESSDASFSRWLHCCKEQGLSAQSLAEPVRPMKDDLNGEVLLSQTIAEELHSPVGSYPKKYGLSEYQYSSDP